ncbi:HET-domain-containing protein, partial [Glonium stellatum]
MKIRDIRDEENSDNDHPALRVKDSVNFGKVRSWLLRCECLQHPRVEGLPVKLRLIDVRRRCLVLHVPQNARYVALSYTWGKLQRNFLRALTSNVGGLTVQGSISPEDHLLPRTIRDAMVVVHNIGGQYLWVDSLCILQNDENDKAEQIDAMASIYVSAAFTIVAAAGHDADAGLPGVLETPREKGQHSEAVQGLRLVNQLRSAREVLDASWWNSRGWTYQERVLSKSMLIFSASQVYFKCPHQLTCEDIVSNGGFYEPNHPDSVSFMSDSVSFYNYQLAVANYTTRNLSSDFDGLRAFLGVADLLGSLLCSGFVFGLPESYFDMALLWHPKSDLRRRVNEGSNEPLFPSWAWAGWSGQI